VSVDRHVVVCGVLTQGGRVLLCHRRADRAWYADVWDFPGGHVEAGELPFAALVRELREELGIEVTSARLQRREGMAGADLAFWVVDDWTGTPANLAPEEHDQVAWFTLDEVRTLALADDFSPALLTEVLLTEVLHGHA